VWGPAAGHRQTENFIEYYLDHAADAATAVGTVALPPQLITMARRRFRQRQPGSAFASGGIEIGLTLPELLQAETATVVAEPSVAKPTAAN
jgi:hypothetical protein